MNWKRITEEHFDYMLGCVPPEALQGNAFLCGEALRFNQKGENVFSAFIMIGEAFYENEKTLREFDPAEWVREIVKGLMTGNISNTKEIV